MMRNRELWIVAFVGALLGGLGVMLSVWGNPENSGICVSCFIENSAGALGLHDNANMQYLRPELLGFVIGSTASAIIFREFNSRGGSVPLARLFMGIFMIFGCAVFIGCPIKLFLRLAAGDLTAVSGVIGLFSGVWIGIKGLANHVEPKASRSGDEYAGYLLPALFLLLLVFFIVRPGYLLYSTKGSGAQQAPWIIALVSGTFLGIMAQRSRFCITGSVRDTLLMGFRVNAIWGLLAFIATAFIFNIVTHRFNVGLYGQPGAHLDYLWSFLGMGLTGWISVIIGGCPFRQLIKAGEGDADAGLVVMGMFIGGALAQSWGIASTSAGVSIYGKTAIIIGFAFVVSFNMVFRRQTA